MLGLLRRLWETWESNSHWICYELVWFFLVQMEVLLSFWEGDAYRFS